MKRFAFLILAYLGILCTTNRIHAQKDSFLTQELIFHRSLTDQFQDTKHEDSSESSTSFIRVLKLKKIFDSNGEPTHEPGLFEYITGYTDKGEEIIEMRYEPRSDVTNPAYVEMNNYIKRVTQLEIGNYIRDLENGVFGYSIDHNEAIKAQAIAARSYAFSNREDAEPYCLIATQVTTNQDIICDVTDTTLHQSYDIYTDVSRVENAVIETGDTYISFYEGAVPSLALYTSDHEGNYSTTEYYAGVIPLTPIPYLISVYDPIQSNHTTSTGQGLSQARSFYWSRGKDVNGLTYPKWTFAKILAHYYTKVNLRSWVDKNERWGDYRWNMLQIYNSAKPDNAYSFETDKQSTITMHVQNTGTVAWPSNLGMQVRWHRYYHGSLDASTPWLSVALNSDTTLEPGADRALYPRVTPPNSIYFGYNYTYSYCAEFDFYLTADAKRMHEQGWETQYWCNFTLFRRVPKPTPAPQPAPSCNEKNCPTPFQAQPVMWTRVAHSDPIDYLWRITDSAGIIVDSGSTPQSPSTSNPSLTPHQLVKGENFVAVQTRQTYPYDVDNVSEETRIATLLYDPDPSHLTLSVPQWIAPHSTVPIPVSITDLVDPNGALGSGIKAYTLTQEYQGTTQTLLTALGTPDTLTINAQPHASIGAVPHQQHQTFTLTTVDYAGNPATLTRHATVDDQAPTLASTTLPRWTNQSSLSVDWSIHDDGIGIQQIALAYRANGGIWSPLPTPSISGTPSTLSATTTLTHLQHDTAYEIHWTLTDAFGNTRQELRTLNIDMVAPTSWVIDPATDSNPHPVVVLPHAWTTLVVAGNDTPKDSLLGGSGIARYQIHPVQVGSLNPELVRPFYAWNYPNPDTLRFKARPNTSYRFQLRAIDYAGNIGPWTWSPVTYQFGTGYDGYWELLLPFFRPTVSSPPPPPAGEPIRLAVEAYPPPEN